MWLVCHTEGSNPGPADPGHVMWLVCHTQGSNPGRAGRAPGRPRPATHACEPRLGQTARAVASPRPSAHASPPATHCPAGYSNPHPNPNPNPKPNPSPNPNLRPIVRQVILTLSLSLTLTLALSLSLSLTLNLTCDPLSGSVSYLDEGGEERTACADMVAGCDGVNSVVRGVASVAMVA